MTAADVVRRQLEQRAATATCPDRCGGAVVVLPLSTLKEWVRLLAPLDMSYMPRTSANHGLVAFALHDCRGYDNPEAKG